MNEALSKKLFDDFPRLYRDRHESSMQRGFECGDGWFDLIYKLSQDIEAAAHDAGLEPDSPDWPRCRQVKEKLGGIRFYVFNCSNERIRALIDSAYEQSCKTCEYCGKPGERATDGGKAAMCPEHAKQAATAPAFPPAYVAASHWAP